MNNEFENNTQFELSYEVLFLLKWLADHEGESLKKIIRRAIKRGFYNKTQQLDTLAVPLEDSLQFSIVDFFNLLDKLLAQAMQEHTDRKALQQNLAPAIQHIDSTMCDDATVQFSVEKATSKIDKNPQKNAREILFEELLKRWKPHKKTVLN